jgi:hypothetical protein
MWPDGFTVKGIAWPKGHAAFLRACSLATSVGPTELIPMRQISKTTPADLGLSAGSGPVRKVKRRNYHRAVDGDGGDHKAVGLSPFAVALAYCPTSERFCVEKAAEG